MNRTLGGWHVGEALSVPGPWLRRSHSTEDQNGCLESVFPSHLCCCSPLWPTPLTNRKPVTGTKDFTSFWLDLAGLCITRKSSEGSGIMWKWDVGTCIGHGAGIPGLHFQEGAVLSSAGTSAPDQGSLTMAQPDSLCPFERRGGIG